MEDLVLVGDEYVTREAAAEYAEAECQALDIGATCNECGEPMHWFAGDTAQEPGYVHDRLADILACPGLAS